MRLAHLNQVPLQWLDRRLRQEGHTILVPFALADDHLQPVKVEVLDPQAKTLHQPQSAAVQQHAHEPANALIMPRSRSGVAAVVLEGDGSRLGSSVPTAFRGRVPHTTRCSSTPFLRGPSERRDSRRGSYAGLSDSKTASTERCGYRAIFSLRHEQFPASQTRLKTQPRFPAG